MRPPPPPLRSQPRPQPWYQSEVLMWLAVFALLLSLWASWYGWKILSSELSYGTALRVLAGLITVGRTIAKREDRGEA
jgi:hypothetical protein